MLGTGAGVEPARTLPGPRDFPSVKYPAREYLPHTKTQLAAVFSSGVVPLSFLIFADSVTQ